MTIVFVHGNDFLNVNLWSLLLFISLVAVFLLNGDLSTN